MSTQAQQILDFALLQSAAECYLDGIPLNNQAELQKRLSWGNNDLRNDHVAAIAAQDFNLLPGATRFTGAQAEWFTTNYESSPITPTTPPASQPRYSRA